MFRLVLVLLFLSGCNGCAPEIYETACGNTCAPLKGMTVASQGNLCICYYYKINPMLLKQADRFTDGGM